MPKRGSRAWGRKTARAIAWILCACVPSASADTVSLQLIGPSGLAPNMAGLFTDPYLALVGAAGQTQPNITGLPAPVICDDFMTDVSLSTPPWQASVTAVADLEQQVVPSRVVKFDQDQTAAQQRYDYTVAAYLALEILGVDQGTAAGQASAGEMSFALWGVFDPDSRDSMGPLSGNSISGSELTAPRNYLIDAESAVRAQHLTPADFPNVIIYTPSPLSASQEYLSIRSVPEPGAFGLLIIGAAAAWWSTKRTRFVRKQVYERKQGRARNRPSRITCPR